MLFLSSSFQKELTKSQSISILVVRINIPLPFTLYFILLLTSNILTGIGVYFMTKADLVLDPGNGIVNTLCIFFNKPFSYLRIRFDISLVIFTAISGLILVQEIIGIGLGTVISAYLISKSVGVTKTLLENKINHYLKKEQ